jgi:hypothetical protein
VVLIEHIKAMFRRLVIALVVFLGQSASRVSILKGGIMAQWDGANVGNISMV